MNEKHQRKHSQGMNSYHEERIQNAISIGDGFLLDTVLHSVRGTRQGFRDSARYITAQYLRAGKELPIPLDILHS
jgi:hypothetical protein